ncbi:MAG: transposase [Pyramidobacter sp.]|nr:transposase [Pyramidobacter sp.]
MSFPQKLERRGGNRANIKSMTSDMSKSCVPAIRDVFTNAVHVIDKFHVEQILINA